MAKSDSLFLRHTQLLCQRSTENQCRDDEMLYEGSKRCVCVTQRTLDAT